MKHPKSHPWNRSLNLSMKNTIIISPSKIYFYSGKMVLVHSVIITQC